MIYFEITDTWTSDEQVVITPGFYHSDIYHGDAHDSAFLQLANRVWIENDDDVRCCIPEEGPVDMKEFTWIKLQSRPLEDFI